MNCSQINQYLSPYLDNELGIDEIKLVKEHLQKCPACMQYYRSLKTIKQYCGDLEDVDLPLDFRERLHQRLVREERKKMPGKFRFKIATGIVAAVVLVFIGIGLSNDIAPKNNTSYDMAASESTSSAKGVGMDETRPDVNTAEDGGFTAKAEPQEEAPFAGEEAGYSAYTISVAERKIIKSAYLDVETLEFDRFINTITGKLNSVGGYIESSNIDGIPHNAQNRVSRRHARFEIRVPKAHYQQIITDVGELGNLLTKQENGEDITGQYFDTEARLKSLQIQEERLLTILQKAEKLQDIIELERELSTVRYEIENLTGTLKKWDNMVEYSRISLDVYEVKELEKNNSEEQTWGQRIVESFTQSLEKLVDFSKDFVVFLASALPYIVVIGAVGWIIWKLVKWSEFFRKRKSNKKGDGENE